jgi:hypothetical protein
MSLLDISLAHARAVPTRPVMAGVLRKDTAPSLLCSCRVTRGHDPRWGEAWQGLEAPHGLAAVACA